VAANSGNGHRAGFRSRLHTSFRWNAQFNTVLHAYNRRLLNINFSPGYKDVRYASSKDGDDLVHAIPAVLCAAAIRARVDSAELRCHSPSRLASGHPSVL